MPALKCLPVLEISSTRAEPVVLTRVSAASSSRQKSGCMVLSASGLFSARWAICASSEREKQVRVGRDED